MPNSWRVENVENYAPKFCESWSSGAVRTSGDRAFPPPSDPSCQYDMSWHVL